MRVCNFTLPSFGALSLLPRVTVNFSGSSIFRWLRLTKERLRFTSKGIQGYWGLDTLIPTESDMSWIDLGHLVLPMWHHLNHHNLSCRHGLYRGKSLMHASQKRVHYFYMLKDLENISSRRYFKDILAQEQSSNDHCDVQEKYHNVSNDKCEWTW